MTMKPISRWLVPSLPMLLATAGCLALAACQSGRHVSPPSPSAAAADSTQDPFLWLEEVTGDKALAWVREQNALSTRALTNRPGFDALRQRLLAIYDSKERIPMVNKLGPHLYNFWRDDQHVRGILRRTSLEEYRKAQPAWETVLDLDRLADTEKENWVWQGFDTLYPDHQRCLISLSRGGADAAVVREFDLQAKQFVQGGFALPEAKSGASWRDRDTLYVATDFGPGSLTSSGYPRLVKEWRRGTPLSSASTVFEGQASDVAVGASVIHDRGRVYEIIQRSITFFSNETLVRRGDRWEKLDKPADADVSTFADQVLFTLRSDWEVAGQRYPAGALLAADAEAYLRGERQLAMLFEPTPRKSLAGISGTRHHLLLNELENVRNRLYVLTLQDGRWNRRPLAAPGLGTLSAWGLDTDNSDDYWLSQTDFLTPSSLSLGSIEGGPAEKWKALPSFFSAEGLRIEQYEAVSKDGTRVPYFQVSPRNLRADGKHLTLLEGYGGFEVSMTSGYNAGVGAAWLERGYVYVLANIRGGGEFGPAWHQAALKAHRQRAYDDFIAVAEDLVRRKVTSPRRLGITGGPMVVCSWATCWCNVRIFLVPSAAGCRCSTCGATVSCSLEQAGWASMEIPTNRRSGSFFRITLPTTRSPPSSVTRRRCSSPPPAMIAFIPATRARWWRA